MSGEIRTIFWMGLCIACLFIWMDYRHISHQEITTTKCGELNGHWQQSYRSVVQFSDGLDVVQFSCPSIVSGMALGLRFLEKTRFSSPVSQEEFDFWNMLLELNPVLGDRTGMRFTGLATYSNNRIDVSPKVLERGDPVEIAGILIHESRHLQQGFNTHVRCLQMEQNTCDRRLEERLTSGGAYNYSVLFYDRVLRHSDANAQAKRSAARLLQKVLDDRFNAVKPELRKQYEP